MTDQNQTWFSLEEACSYLRLGPSTIRAAVRSGQITYTRTDSRKPLSQLRFRRDWLDRYLEKNVQRAKVETITVNSEKQERRR